MHVPEGVFLVLGADSAESIALKSYLEPVDLKHVLGLLDQGHSELRVVLVLPA